MTTPRALALCLALLTTGCLGNIRDTTTARGSTEMLLLSSAMESAISRWDVSALEGRRVFIDTQFLDTVDEPYVTSSLRYRAARGGAILVDAPEAELVVEVRCGAFACWDGEFLLGLPPLALGQFGLSVISPDFTIGNTNRQAWAKMQLFVYEPHTREVLATSGDLWGAAREDLFGSVYPSLLDTAGATIESGTASNQ